MDTEDALEIVRVAARASCLDTQTAQVAVMQAYYGGMMIDMPEGFAEFRALCEATKTHVDCERMLLAAAEGAEK